MSLWRDLWTEGGGAGAGVSCEQGPIAVKRTLTHSPAQPLPQTSHKHLPPVRVPQCALCALFVGNDLSNVSNRAGNVAQRMDMARVKGAGTRVVGGAGPACGGKCDHIATVKTGCTRRTKVMGGEESGARDKSG